MQVYKFGGSSIKDEYGIRNIASLINDFNGKLCVVLSALGKTTNKLEKLVNLIWGKHEGGMALLEDLKDFHLDVYRKLLKEGNGNNYIKLIESFDDLEEWLDKNFRKDYDYLYDQIVSRGEFWSTLIVKDYLEFIACKISFVDATELIITDNNFRDARVDWDQTTQLIRAKLNFKNENIYLTQGFIGSTPDCDFTTLGREGSDFTASIFGNILDADKVVIWKDVEGILNADPNLMEDSVLLSELSYQEAIELAYFGAKVLHPKTIKPLQNKTIPLFVKSFNFPEKDGSQIKREANIPDSISSYIFKKDQLLISISPRDFSFVVDQSLGEIFSILNSYKIKVNLVQNSAISISVCVDYDERKFQELLTELEKKYKVYYNREVELITIRHYSEDAIRNVLKKVDILIEQKTRSTVHYLVKRNS